LYLVPISSETRFFIPPQWNLEGITVEPNNEISAVDKAFVFLNYPFFGGPSSDPPISLANALDIAGIMGVYRRNIETEFAHGDWEGVRAELARWSVNQRAAADKAVSVKRREAIAASVSAGTLAFGV
jgi:hypothetical protein